MKPFEPNESDLIVDGFLAESSLPVSGCEQCPYLPEQQASSEGFFVDTEMEADIYRAFMDRGFRRSGRVFYRPACAKCESCIPMRIPAMRFEPTKSMRRVWRKNADVTVVEGDYKPSKAKFELFVRYLDGQHDDTMSRERESFKDFLYGSPVPAKEFCYKLGERLIGVSIADDLPNALSSVYMYFDPEEAARSLGTFSVMAEIEHCRREGIAYYYLGYYVPGSKTMSYKARFAPAEILNRDGDWVAFDRNDYE
ncbi:MAG TPA: arginyltransferase [Phycisphaerae bacterium]|nr:arginyltransferase [Phycisphaerales bacterium]HNO80258.1 arginyltransferase [Phycisphaerae bacterium]